MTEYIIRWDGIARQLMELRNNGVPLQLWSKRIRAERLREPIVRCKDCENWCIDTCQLFPTVDEPDGFCAWGERKVVE